MGIFIVIKSLIWKRQIKEIVEKVNVEVNVCAKRS